MLLLRSVLLRRLRLLLLLRRLLVGVLLIGILLMIWITATLLRRLWPAVPSSAGTTGGARPACSAWPAASVVPIALTEHDEQNDDQDDDDDRDDDTDDEPHVG